MRCPRRALVAGRVRGVFLCLDVLLAGAADIAAQSAEQTETTVAKVLAAWERNRERVQSFQYRCDVEEWLKKSRLPVPGKPFAAPDKNAAKDAILSRWSVALSVSGNKVAYCKEGEHWDAASDTRYHLKEREVYDGTSERFLSEGRVSMAHVRTEPGDSTMLMQDIALIPFFAPCATIDVFQRLGLDAKRMTVSQHRAFHEGRDCVELTIPSADPRSTSLCRVYADASRDYLPVELSRLRKDRVVHRSSIEYAADPDARWRISTVRIAVFDESGPFRSWSYKVKEYSINKALDEATFTLEFPEGTQVIEGPRVMLPGEDAKTRKYYVVKRGGGNTPMSPKDYGRRTPIPTSAQEGASAARLIAAAIAGCLLVAAAVVVGWRTWRRRRM